MNTVLSGKIKLIGVGLLLAAVVWPSGLMAQDQNEEGGVTASSSVTTEAAEAEDAEAEVENYWTSERLQEAEPPQLPTPDTLSPEGIPEGAVLVTPELTIPPDLSPEMEQDEHGQEGSLPTQEGSPPTVDPGDSLAEPIGFAPDRAEPVEQEVGTTATSSLGAHFTTRRVSAAVDQEWPYRATGKLFFRDPRRGTDHVCSAAVLRLRVVATAGHCVTNPSTDPANRYFFTNFLFVPALDNGLAPYGSWTSTQQWISNDWHLSNGSVPNRGDMAMLIIRDQPVSGATRKIGEVTGWLGWRANALGRNHVTMLGYPCNLDSCRRMIETGANVFASGGENTYIYGSSSRGGHSGGPFIQDFGVAPAGSPPNSSGLNYLVGITSYGPTATEPKYLGASDFGSNFSNLLTAACNATPGNC